ncbi:MAG: T9SS type A sorting domain-containing protein [Candidatus Goldiibacteriota bacterium]|jgi:hypothetical protein
MKKTAMIILTISILFCSGVMALETTILNPTPDTPVIYGVHATGDGGSIITGSYENNFAGGEGFLILTSAAGNITFNNVDYSYMYFDACKSGNGYVIAAGLTYTATTQTDNTHQLVILTADSNGLTTGARISGDLNTTPVAVTNCADNSGFVIAADYYNYNATGYSSPYFEKVNSSGAKVWSNHFDFTNDIYLYSITPLSDGGYIAAGYDYSDSNGFLMKVDATGNSVWATENSACTSYDDIALRPDGSMLATCYIDANPDYYFMIQAIDSNGNTLWSKTYNPYPGYDFNDYSIFYSGSNDCGYIITGSTTYPEGYSNTSHNFALGIDSNGNTMNYTSFGDGSQDIEYGVGTSIGNQQADIVGTIGESQIYWNRFTLSSVVAPPPAGGASAYNAYAYPEPASDYVNIVYSLTAQSNVTINIYNFANTLVGQNQTLESPDNSVTTKVDVSRLKPGVYFYEVVAKALNGGETRFKPNKFMVKR